MRRIRSVSQDNSGCKMKNSIHHLSIKWTVSRGRDTYGYNICRLSDSQTGQSYKTCGGGYDMLGTVLANWLDSNFQAELQALASTVEQVVYTDTRTCCKEFYGMFMRSDQTVHLDGGCGLDCMMKIAESIGLEIEREYIRTGKNRGETTGYFAQMKSV
jgi:hypothetical protein